MCLGTVALALALVSTPVVAPQRGATAHADDPVTLRVALTQDIDSFNPFLASLQSSTEIGRLMYEFLTTYDAKDQHPVPALATKWTFSPDRLTWTYTIRDDAKWSDGKPITAQDIAFTYNLMMKDKDAQEANGNFVRNFQSVTAPNGRTLVIRTKSPQASMLALDIPIVPEHVWSSVKNIADYKNEPSPGKPVIGSGPFILTEYKAGEYVKLKANKNYWRGAPKVDELQFVNYDNTDGAVAALRSGNLDLVNNLTPEQYKALQGEQDVKLNKAKGRRYTSLLLNPGAATSRNQPIGDGNPALRDVRVRRAIADVIDIKKIVSQVYDGFAQSGGATIPPVFTDYHWNPSSSQQRKVDKNAANQLLDQAGYRRGADGMRRGRGGKLLELRLIARNNHPLDQAMAKYIVDWLGGIGIKVDSSTIDSGRLNDATNAGNYDLSFSGYGVNPDPDYILSIQTCHSRPNANGGGATTANFFCDKQYDELYAKQLRTFDKPARAKLVKQMQQRIYDQVPEFTLVYQNVLEAYRSDRFASFQTQPDPGGVIMGQNGYWGYYSADPTAKARSGSSINTGLVVGIVIAAIVVIGVVILVFSRRRARTAEHRE
ncbi:MAG: ABC transporter substrate-binding protein [Sciscionella sp.]